jgi:hypothetical protein
VTRQNKFVWALPKKGVGAKINWGNVKENEIKKSKWGKDKHAHIAGTILTVNKKFI